MCEPISIKEQYIWLPSGHPSFGYMKHKLPDLFSHMPNFDLNVIPAFWLKVIEFTTF